jgi:hypothetical protein
MTRRYGRAPRGQRLVAGVPHGHWKTSTFLAALRCDGITAPCVIDGPINGETFLAYVRQLIEAAGAQLRYLPPYSPDFNPIEQLFAKLKAILRKIAARTVGTLWSAVGEILPLFSAAECANYFENAGYLLPNRNPL